MVWLSVTTSALTGTWFADHTVGSFQLPTLRVCRGQGAIVTVMEAIVPTGQLVSVQVAVYVVVEVGETRMLLPVAPVFQFMIPLQPEADRVVLEPEQTWLAGKALSIGMFDEHGVYRPWTLLYLPEK